jgi:hypothetical protein
MGKVTLLSILGSSIFASLVIGQTPETSIIKPGIPWYDTDGNRIYAGGSNIYTENGIYYLIGEGKKVYSGKFI